MLHVYYGKGKGKTSSALGLILRAAGYKKRIILFQFLKPSRLFSGEQASLKKFPNLNQIRFDQKHPIFMLRDKKEQIKALRVHVKKSILKLKQVIKGGKFDILVCDEILNLIDCQLIKEVDMVKLFRSIRDKKEIILTGRPKLKKLIKLADYATEFRQVKHPFQKGTLARKCIEY